MQKRLSTEGGSLCVAACYARRLPAWVMICLASTRCLQVLEIGHADLRVPGHMWFPSSKKILHQLLSIRLAGFNNVKLKFHVTSEQNWLNRHVPRLRPRWPSYYCLFLWGFKAMASFKVCRKVKVKVNMKLRTAARVAIQQRRQCMRRYMAGWNRWGTLKTSRAAPESEFITMSVYMLL